MLEIERGIDLGLTELRANVGIGSKEVVELSLAGERTHRVALHEHLGALTREALAHEREQDALAGPEAACLREVLREVLGIDRSRLDSIPQN